MIGQITKHSRFTLIQPLFSATDIHDMWLSMYDCGFNNMTVAMINGCCPALKIDNQPIPKLTTGI